MKIIDMDAEQVAFPDIKVGTFFTTPNGTDLLVKLAEADEGWNAFNISGGRKVRLSVNSLVIPREAEIRHWRKGGAT